MLAPIFAEINVTRPERSEICDTKEKKNALWEELKGKGKRPDCVTRYRKHVSLRPIRDPWRRYRL